MKKLAIIVLNYNGKHLLEKSLDSVLKQASKNVQIIVVDNGSTDGSSRLIEKMVQSGKPIKLIKASANLGFSGGNNLGIKWALKKGFDYLMLLNNDVLVRQPFWKKMITYLEENKSIGLLSPKIYFAPGYETHKDRYRKKDFGRVIWYAGGIVDWDNVYASHRGVDQVDHGQFDEIIETDFLTGCCLIGRKEVWEKVGLLDDKYFLYYEDADFSQRVKGAGFSIKYFSQSSLWHMNAETTGCGSPMQDYFMSRNRILFGFRYCRLRTKLSLIKESVRILFTGRKWQKIGVRDFYLANFGQGSWK